METMTDTEIRKAGFVQGREWMLYRVRPDHYPMNVMVHFQLDVFDHVIFQQTIDQLVCDHEIFRTTLRVIRGSLNQIIHAPSSFSVGFDYLDLTGLPPSRQAKVLANKQGLLFNTPFNFEFGPLFRIAVCRTAADRYDIAFVFHHVIFDQHSTAIFKAHAAGIWRSLLGDASLTSRDKYGQYRNYVNFEHELLDTTMGENHREYWKDQLKKGLPRLLLISQNRWDAYLEQHIRKVKEVKKRVFSLSFYDKRFIASVIRRYTYNQAGAIHFTYSDDTCRRIAAYRNSINSNLYSLFVASFLMALHRLSGQELFVFDIPASRRTDGAFKDTIGWLAAGGICYFEMGSCTSLSAFLSYIDQQLFHLAKHCIYPFEILDHESEIPIGSTMPVFFTLEDTGMDREEGPWTSGITDHEREGPAACQDMDIYLRLYNDSCKLRLVYNNFLLTPEVMEKLVLEQESSINTLTMDLLKGHDDD